MPGLVLRPQVGLWAQEGGRRGMFINTCSRLSKCSEANREGFLSHLVQENHKGLLLGQSSGNDGSKCLSQNKESAGRQVTRKENEKRAPRGI